MISLLALVWAFGAAPLQDSGDPLAPAQDGKLQCYSPDRANKTCQSLAGYVRDGRGGYRNSAEVLLAKAPRLTLETVTPVTIKSGAVCGFIRKQDIDAGIVRQDGAPITGEAAQRILDAASRAVAPLADQEICTNYIADGDHWIARGTMGGAAGKLPDQMVIWVSHADGYRVAR
jgi:hypothetical protein